jgi:hypothetical protein
MLQPFREVMLTGTQGFSVLQTCSAAILTEITLLAKKSTD